MRAVFGSIGLWIAAWLLALLPHMAFADETLEGDHVRIGWLAPEAFDSGVETIGVYFRVDPHWHVYWRNPGDSGAAPKFKYSGNAHFSDVLWPAPVRLPVAHLTNLGYEGDVAYLVEVTPDAGSGQVRISLDLEWLVCQEECIPGFGVLTLERPVEAAGRWQAELQNLRDGFLARVPQSAAASPWRIEAASVVSGGEVSVRVIGPAPDAPQLYPMEAGFLSPAAPDVEREGEGWRLAFATNPGMAQPEHLGFVLTADGRAWEFGDVTLTVSPTSAVQFQANEDTALWVLLLAAFAGGVILNLMPCVFPVLAIKLFGLVNAVGDGPAALRHRLSEGLLYTLGVLVTFAALGAVFLALRAGGAAVGWGFQLQSPAVVLALILLFWLMALSFAGAFEFGHGLVRLAGKGSGGSFATGALAVFVAAPCTGPFMGAALGASAMLPALQAMAIFLGLGAGLAAPFLLLVAVPALANRLPRPGAWMETLRQFLAFPLFATVLWLLWVLGRLSGEGGWLLGGGLILLLSFAIWLSRSGRRMVKFAAMALAISALMIGFRKLPTLQPVQAAASQADWQAFDETLIEQALARGQAVFIDYTAAWCITCQVNKAVVLDTPEANQLFVAHDVLRVRADWTRYDPAITQSLARLGRNSVPVYAFYPAGGGSVQLLPQILSHAVIRDLFTDPTMEIRP